MNNKTRNTFLSYFFLLLSFFVIILFTKNFYINFLEISKQKELLSQTLIEKNKQLEEISKIKSNIDNWNVSDINFDKFLIDFSEDELVKYFYDYTNVNKTVVIEKISLDPGFKNDYGFTEGKIELSVVVSSEQELIKMLNFLLNSEKYNLYIHDFSYPFWNTTKPFKVNIPLKVLYK